MKNVLNIGTASLSCSVCLVIPNRGFIFLPWVFFFLHILIQKYLSIVPLNFVGLYNTHLQQSNLLCCLIISDFFCAIIYVVPFEEEAMF